MSKASISGESGSQPCTSTPTGPNSSIEVKSTSPELICLTPGILAIWSPSLASSTLVSRLLDAPLLDDDVDLLPLVDVHERPLEAAGNAHQGHHRADGHRHADHGQARSDAAADHVFQDEGIESHQDTCSWDRHFPYCHCFGRRGVLSTANGYGKADGDRNSGRQAAKSKKPSPFPQTSSPPRTRQSKTSGSSDCGLETGEKGIRVHRVREAHPPESKQPFGRLHTPNVAGVGKLGKTGIREFGSR